VPAAAPTKAPILAPLPPPARPPIAAPAPAAGNRSSGSLVLARGGLTQGFGFDVVLVSVDGDGSDTTGSSVAHAKREMNRAARARHLPGSIGYQHREKTGVNWQQLQARYE
jgi:hypothetical protein